MYLPLFEGALCLVLALLCITKCPFEFCFALVVLLMSYECKYFVALPHGVVVWAAVCDFGMR